jgi:ATP phosphoribosyltransferase regulatory subunit
MGGPEGDVELMTLAASAVRSTGLTSFMLDLGHADIARALLPVCAAPLGSAILDALAHKDSARLRELVGQTDASSEVSEALCQLPELHGDAGIWNEATRLLGSTPAAPALSALRDLWDRAALAGLESVLRVDLGEVRGFAYYTGAIFHLLAEGPGEPIGSGGRYDDLLGRFGAPMPAAGFALDLDNLSWALRAQGAEAPREPRVLVLSSPRSLAICESLRRFGVGCVISRDADPEGYARAWGFSHILRERGPFDVELLTLSSNLRQTLAGGPSQRGASEGGETALASHLAEVVRNG